MNLVISNSLLLILQFSICLITQGQSALLLSKEFSTRLHTTDNWEPLAQYQYQYHPDGNLFHETVVNYPGTAYAYTTHKLYNKWGNLTRSIGWYFDEDLQKIDTALYHTLKYNDQNQVLEERYLETDFEKNLLPRYAYVYQYNEKHCLEETQYYVWYAESQDLALAQTNSYERASDCTLVSEEIIGHLNGDNTRLEYFNEASGDRLRIKTYSRSPGSTEWILREEEVITNDPAGRPINAMLNAYALSEAGSKTRRRWEYETPDSNYTYYLEEQFLDSLRQWQPVLEESFILDPQGIRRSTFKESHLYIRDQIIAFKTVNSYSFDSNGWLDFQESTREIVQNDTILQQVINETSYQTRCDGAILESIQKNVLNFDHRFSNPNLYEDQRFQYRYGRPAGCEAELQHFELTVYPNPSDGQASLKSELLYYPGTRVKIIAANGVVIWETVSRITEVQAMQLPDLSAGLYIIQLSNQDLGKTAIEKLVVF